MSIEKKFSHSLRWSTIEALTYQALLALHNLALFKFLPLAEYGLVGITFQLISVATYVINLGINTSLEPFYTTYTRSKKLFRSLFLSQLIIQALFFAVLSVAGYYLWPRVPFNPKLAPVLNNTFYLLLAVIITSEAFKKTVKLFLQLAFYTKHVAFWEVGTFVGYLIATWSAAALGFPLTLHTVVAPYLIGTTLCLIIFLFYVWHLYQHLPESDHDHAPINYVHTIKRIVITRFFTYFNLLSNTFFSNKTIIPILGVYGGLPQAGIATLISSFIAFSTSAILNIFGVSASAAFSQAKNFALEKKQELFTQTTASLMFLLYLMSTISVYVITVVYWSSPSAHTQTPWMPIVAIVACALLANILVPYERFYNAEEKSHWLVSANVTNAGLLWLIAHYAAKLSATSLCSAFITCRLINFCVIVGLALVTWGIRPAFHIKLRPALAGLAILALPLTISISLDSERLSKVANQASHYRMMIASLVQRGHRDRAGRLA